MITLERDGSSKKQLLITSILCAGLSYILYFKQYFKGVLLVLSEIIMLRLLPVLFRALGNFVTLGSANPDLAIANRDNSAFMMIDGIIAILALAAYLVIYVYYVKASLREYSDYCRTGEYHILNKTFTEMIHDSFMYWGLLPAVLLVGLLVIVPVLFAVLAAFTNLSAPANIAPSMTFDWVGLRNFVTLFGGQREWSSAFVRVLVWTLVFAVCSTALCYIGGLVLAYILNHNHFRFRPALQAVLMLPYAIPAAISMLVWRNLLNGSFGVVNRTLMELHLISEPVPWLSDPIMAKITCILLSLWAGYSYFMLMLLTSLSTISPAIYDSAAVDGATRGQTIRKVIVPLLIQRTSPFIFLAFAQNLNNFTTVFFLTAGDPALANTTTTSAGGSDTLITWIYNLTFRLMKFNYASVITVVLFVVLVPVSMLQFRKTNMYRKSV